MSLKIQPAPANSGIKFKRKDLPDEPTIDATIANVKTVERATTIGEGSMRVHTVEHVLVGALRARGRQCGRRDGRKRAADRRRQRAALCRGDPEGRASCRRKRRDCFFTSASRSRSRPKSGSLLVLLPDDEFRISCTQAGPEGRFTQFMSTAITPAIYEREIAPRAPLFTTRTCSR